MYSAENESYCSTRIHWVSKDVCLRIDPTSIDELAH
jgi:hypothetical protein